MSPIPSFGQSARPGLGGERPASTSVRWPTAAVGASPQSTCPTATCASTAATTPSTFAWSWTRPAPRDTRLGLRRQPMPAGAAPAGGCTPSPAERVLPCAGLGRGAADPVQQLGGDHFDLSHAGQVELARKAAAIGVEMFCVDDGWFGARRNDHAGLGDWVVSPEVFPDGLDPLIDEVHRLGMRFGIWVEPEMVNPDSDLYRQHPDWVLHFPGRPRTEARYQLDPGLRATGGSRPPSTTVLDDLLSRHAIDFIKWDMNRNVTEPGSAAGQAIWRSIPRPCTVSWTGCAASIRICPSKAARAAAAVSTWESWPAPTSSGPATTPTPSTVSASRRAAAWSTRPWRWRHGSPMCRTTRPAASAR